MAAGKSSKRWVVAAWPVTSTGDAMAFSWYVILAAAVSLGGLLTLPRTLGHRMD